MIKWPHWDQGRGQKLIENVLASLLSYIIKTTMKYIPPARLVQCCKSLHLHIFTPLLIYSVQLAPVTLGIFCHCNRSILRNCETRTCSRIGNTLTDLCLNNDARECAYKYVAPMWFLGCKKALRLRDHVRHEWALSRQMAYNICSGSGGRISYVGTQLPG